MSIVWGLIFNRYSLLILAIVVVVALVGAQKLVWNRYTIGGLVLLALGIGLWSWHDKAVKEDRIAVSAPYIEMIKKTNDEAAAKLKEETAKTTAITKAFKEFSTQQEKIDVTNTQAITALNTKLRATRLRDPGKTGGCSSSAQSSNTGSANSSATDAGQGSGLLSNEASDFLWDFALDADRINEAYRSCKSYAQTVRDKLAIADAEPLVLAMSGWAAP